MAVDNNDALEGGENTHLPAASPAAAAPVSKLFQPRSQPEISWPQSGTNKPCVIVVEDPIIVPVLALPVYPREGYGVRSIQTKP